MITQVQFKNLRSQEHASYTLGPKTILIGRNGSGKSTVRHAIDLALLGYIPGFDKKTVFANSLDGKTMGAGVQIDGHTILRSWTQGKTLQERVSVDGNAANKTAAAGMIALAVGSEPKTIDLESFWAASSAEKRRMILRLACDDEEQDRLFRAEKDCRSEHNNTMAVRRQAEAAAARITKELADLPRPPGDMAKLEEERKDVHEQLADVQKRLAQGQANDGLRLKLANMADALSAMKESVSEAEESLRLACEARKQAQEALEAFKEPDLTSECDTPQEAVQLSLGLLPALRKVSGLMADNQLLQRALLDIESLLPDPKVEKALARAVRERSTLVGNVEKSDSAVSAADQKLQLAKDRLEANEKAVSDASDVGPGVSDEDNAMNLALTNRLADLTKSLDEIREYEAVVRQVEKARVAADECRVKEAQTKDALQSAMEAQSAVLRGAATTLAERSRMVLPAGSLCIEDDGSELTVSWEHVQRHTLSGGERVIFDAALGHALAPAALVTLEAAECDDTTLSKVMDRLSKCDFQVLICTCHQLVGTVPSEWTVIAVG